MRPSGRSWFEVVKDRAPLSDVAAALGLEVRRGRCGPCPACNAGPGSDHRQPIGFRPDGAGWRCFHCNVSGDAVDLAAWKLHGTPARELRGDTEHQRRAELRAWFAARAWCDDDSGGVRMGAYMDRVMGGLAPRASRPSPKGPPAPPTRPPEPSPPPARAFLPSADVGALWAACAPLDVVAADRQTELSRRAAVAWLERVRGLPPGLIAAADMARVLPAAYPWPWWVPRFVREVVADGPATGVRPYALAVPVFDVAGELRALRFRAVSPLPLRSGERVDLRIKGPKSAACARDGDGRRGGPFVVVAGLVLADPMALVLLRHQGPGPVEADGVRWSGRVVVLEGEPAWWAYATHPDRQRAGADGAPETFATFGIEAGAWTPEIAARIPSTARVLVWTDHDEAGDRYYATVRDTLAGRVDVHRTARPSEWGTDGT